MSESLDQTSAVSAPQQKRSQRTLQRILDLTALLNIVFRLASVGR